MSTSDRAELLELRLLLGNLKKAVELSFLVDSQRIPGEGAAETQSSIQSIQITCVEILRHGLRSLAIDKEEFTENYTNHLLPAATDADADTDQLRKLIEDFEWVRRSAQIRDSLATEQQAANDSSTTPGIPLSLNVQLTDVSTAQCIEQFLRSWILRNLKANYLCACLQQLITDKELLESHYTDNAFLRNEAYAAALFLCLSAYEQNQYSLLSQIEVELYGSQSITAIKHKRCSSHPTFSISPPKRPQLKTHKSEEAGSSPSNWATKQSTVQFPTFRKVKSLPRLQIDEPSEAGASTSVKTMRPRSKTVTTATLPKPVQRQTKIEPKADKNHKAIPSNTETLSLGYSEALDVQPSTSAGSKRSNLSNYTMQSTSSTPSTSTASTSSAISSTTARKIELINCDDIKIWTDHSYGESQQQQQQQQHETSTTESCAIPENSLSVKPAKSISPINNFLCNLFSTPPKYTSWLHNQNDHDECPQLPEATEADCYNAFPCKTPHQLDCSSTSMGGVFDGFLPIYGKKLRSRKSQNLFEDGISSLDYTTSPPSSSSSTAVAAAATTTTTNTTCLNTKTNENLNETSPANSSGISTTAMAPKNCQNLTTFLQMSQLSRNNTELEKENAHFRISEAIISAIEHMKWAKMEPDKEPNTATDWLAGEQYDSGSRRNSETEDWMCDEHIPYAEFGVNGSELPSAEAVGLSLISKFNDKHMPKVSELKWLVSEEDTPQQLLPMPDNSPSANPDENVIPSMTRGTKYWAPPRQQIIFTEHPTPNRRELIQKQNNRCAGCGMRVSPQYLHSFRYCTYLGKYHCTGCHRNQISAIPAKILNAWDFKCYPVSVFAYRLLEQMYTYPLFYVPDLNPALYVRSKALLTARNKRLQLKYVKDFVKTCRFAAREQFYFHSIPDYITNDPDAWSMSDFIDTHNKSMQRSIDELIERCENHIFNCVLCTARGFICEYCQKDQVIYPWQNHTFRCDHCGSCFHLNCWKSMLEQCCRCERLNKRQDEIIEV